MAKTSKTNKKHYATAQEKHEQRLRTKANKIKRLTNMLKANPNDKLAQKQLEKWKGQLIK